MEVGVNDEMITLHDNERCLSLRCDIDLPVIGFSWAREGVGCEDETH